MLKRRFSFEWVLKGFLLSYPATCKIFKVKELFFFVCCDTQVVYTLPMVLRSRSLCIPVANSHKLHVDNTVDFDGIRISRDNYNPLFSRSQWA